MYKTNLAARAAKEIKDSLRSAEASGARHIKGCLIYPNKNHYNDVALTTCYTYPLALFI